jgi:hypothetical protein
VSDSGVGTIVGISKLSVGKLGFNTTECQNTTTSSNGILVIFKILDGILVICSKFIN